MKARLLALWLLVQQPARWLWHEGGDVLMVATAIALFVVPIACTKTPPPLDPSVVAPSCAVACSRARELCGPATLTPKTGSCEDVCETTERNGGDFRTACLSSAGTCEDVERCSR